MFLAGLVKVVKAMRLRLPNAIPMGHTLPNHCQTFLNGAAGATRLLNASRVGFARLVANTFTKQSESYYQNVISVAYIPWTGV